MLVSIKVLIQTGQKPDSSNRYNYLSGWAQIKRNKRGIPQGFFKIKSPRNYDFFFKFFGLIHSMGIQEQGPQMDLLSPPGQGCIMDSTKQVANPLYTFPRCLSAHESFRGLRSCTKYSTAARSWRVHTSRSSPPQSRRSYQKCSMVQAT